MEEQIIRIAEKAILQAVQTELTGYNKPLSKFVEQVMANHQAEFVKLIDVEVVAMLTAESFRAALKEALNLHLAKLLVNRLGGELEKQVNSLKSNPETNAKITLAISNVIKEVAQGSGK